MCRHHLPPELRFPSYRKDLFRDLRNLPYSPNRRVQDHPATEGSPPVQAASPVPVRSLPPVRIPALREPSQLPPVRVLPLQGQVPGPELVPVPEPAAIQPELVPEPGPGLVPEPGPGLGLGLEPAVTQPEPPELPLPVFPRPALHPVESLPPR